jgi:CRP/FNR family cyclic AMP-dependent transcriptional regulator
MRDLKLTYLTNIDIFQDLSESELADMDRQITMSSSSAGKIFYMPEDTGEVLFLLKKGRVQLYRISPNGKKLVVATLGPGAMFGEMSLVGQGMHNTFAESIDECLICVMSRADVDRLMREKPTVAFRFVEALGGRVTNLESRLEEIAFKSIPARLASLLLRLADEQGDGAVEGGAQVNGFTHQDLGEMLGTYRETITQTLNEFKAEGMVIIGRKHIELIDLDSLEFLAET